MMVKKAAVCRETVFHPMSRVAPRTWGILMIVPMLVFILELCLGSVMIPPRGVWAVLTNQAGVSEGWREIILVFRLPRAVAAMLAGAALGVAGLEMQTLFRNPLADPFILGISSGASLGVALLVLGAWGFGVQRVMEKSGFFGNCSLVMAAVAGSIAVLCLVLGIARKVESSLTLLIVGLMFGYISSSLVSILLHFAQEQQMQSYITWTFGSFGGVTWVQLLVFTPAVFSGLAVAWILAKPLNAVLLGESYARSMGENIHRIRFWIILGASLLAGTVTAYCGPIGFLGIAVPHLCRSILKTSDHHMLVPAVILMGAALAMIADLLAQAPGTRIMLPLNAVTSLIGAPVVIGVILRRQKAMEAGA
jgi:iron complex transport system permease protein